MAQRAGYTQLQGDDPEAGGAARAPREEASAPAPRGDDDAACIERMLFTWASPMIEVGYERQLKPSDLYPIGRGDAAAVVATMWDASWGRELAQSRGWAPLLAGGARVTDDRGRGGVLKWIGTLSHAPDDAACLLYAGVEWDEKRRGLQGAPTFEKVMVGGDGWYKGVRVFDCADGRGSFIRPHLLTPQQGGSPAGPAPEAPQIWRGLARSFGWQFAKGGMFKVMNDVTIFAGPICIELIIKFLQSDDPTWGRGIAICAVLLVCQLIQSFAMNQYFFIVARVGLRMRQALSCAVFDQALRLSNRARALPEHNVGRITNMMSQDAQRANDVVQSLHQMWSAPFQIIVGCVMLYRLVGVSLFAGIGVMVLLSPLQTKIMQKLMKNRAEIMQLADKRVQASTELFSGIRIVKYMVWGGRFRDEVQGRRNAEVDKLRSNQNLRVCLFFLIWLTPMFLQAATWIVYVALAGEFKADVIFPSIQLFGIIRFPFLILPMQFGNLTQAKVSFDRLSLFLSARGGEGGTGDTQGPAHGEGKGETVDDAATPIVPLRDSEEDCAIVIEDGNFIAYEPQPLPYAATSDTGIERLRPCTPAELAARSPEASVLVAVAADIMWSAAKKAAGKRAKDAEKAAKKAGGAPAADASPGGKGAASPAASPAGGKGAASPAGGKGKGPAKGGKGKGKGKGSVVAPQKLEPKPVLRDVNLSLRRGKLTMVVGPTGCGKSCLLDAMLGGLDGAAVARPPRVARAGALCGAGAWAPAPVAYCPQQPWIMNGTVRANITFFQEHAPGEADALYESAVRLCQLEDDLEQLEGGDGTEIGEKGINLSGGQRARVSLARAVYSKRGIYFLDDPLSAVDPHVGRALMKGVIGGAADEERAALRGTTRVLVTHQLHFLDSADDIVVLRPGGVAAIFRGDRVATALQQALATTDWPGASFLDELRKDRMQRHSGDSGLGEQQRSDSVVKPKAAAPPPPGGPDKEKEKGNKLMTEEERAKGSVDSHMYASYVRAAGGWPWIAFVMFLFLLNESCFRFTDLWVTWWTDSSEKDADKRNKPPLGDSLSDYEHLYVYIGLFLFSGTVNLGRGFFAYSRFGQASRAFHYDLLNNMIRAPVSFYDTTPLGRLINRVSKDIDQIDNVLPPTIMSFFQLSFQTLSQMCVMISSQPLVLLIISPAAFVYIKILKRFIRTNRETKRLDSINKSPIFAHFTETLNGMKTIHAYQVQQQFREASQAKMDKNTQTTFANVVCNRWLAIRLELLGTFVVLVMLMLAVVTRMETKDINNSSVGLLSLGITYALGLTQALNFLVRQCADLEAQMNGVERIVQYTEEIDQEPLLKYDDSALARDGPGARASRASVRGLRSLRIEDVPQLRRGDQLFQEDSDVFGIVRRVDKEQLLLEIPAGDNKHSVSFPVGKAWSGGELAGGFTRRYAPARSHAWPESATLEFDNVQLRYRQGLDLVLKGLCDPLTSGPLVVAAGAKVGVVGRTGAGKSTLMLGLFRFVELAGGSIRLAGRDISTVSLDDLRRNIAMIPQDPVLFHGTVRSNLDPFELSEPPELWAALENVGMTRRIKAHDGRLDGVVTDGGQNFSVGERQLLCLARALLKSGCQLLLMDEATASIDHQTDLLIQQTVREKFRGYTTLTIAHRLQTIMDSTSIMVLKRGMCVEYNSPSALLEQTGGEFYSMVQQTGDFSRLQRIARGEIRVVEILELQARELLECGGPLLAVLAAAVAAVAAGPEVDGADLSGLSGGRWSSGAAAGGR